MIKSHINDCESISQNFNIRILVRRISLLLGEEFNEE